MQRVVDDLLDGYITLEGARRDYGVVIDGAGAVDEPATVALRARLAATDVASAEEAWDRGAWSYGGLSWP